MTIARKFGTVICAAAVIAVVIAAACGGQATPTPAPADAPEATATALPEPTATPIPVDTPAATATARPLPVDTPEPTATALPEPTATPVPVQTPEPTATVLPQPTATSTPAPEPTPEPADEYIRVEVIDGNGELFVFEQAPERIIAYDASVVEILFAIGEGDRVLATHDFVTFPPEAESVTRVGNAFEISVEVILSLEPDLVFLFSPGFLDDLQAAGLRVLYLPSRSADFADTAEDMRLWGRIVGSPQAAEELAEDFEARLAALNGTLSAIQAGPRVFRDEGGLWTPGPDTLIGEVLETLKLENIAADVSGYEQISPEIVVERDPEVIIATEFSTIDSDPAFSEVTAVREGRVIRMVGEPLSVPGTRFMQGVENLARAIYPDLFE